MDNGITGLTPPPQQERQNSDYKTSEWQAAESPHVSIIIVTYNSTNWIVDCLNALIAQEQAPPYEIIVVDNASTDSTTQIIERAFPGVRLILSENRGFGAGNNVGAKNARGSWLAFINPDTQADPLWLHELIASAEKRPRCVTTSKIVLMDRPDLLNTCGNVNHFTGFGFVNGWLATESSIQADFEVDGISGAAFLIAADTFQEVGGFDEDFFLYMEDTELSWRLKRHGIPVFVSARSKTKHAYSMRASAAKTYRLELGRHLILRKHLRGIDWILLAPSLLVSEALSFGYATTQGWKGVRAKIKGTQDAWAFSLTDRQDIAKRSPTKFCSWRIPEKTVSQSRMVRAVASVANAIFWLNTFPYQMRSSKQISGTTTIKSGGE